MNRMAPSHSYGARCYNSLYSFFCLNFLFIVMLFAFSYSRDACFLFFQIRNKTLRFRFNLNQHRYAEQELWLPHVIVSDGQWHTVNVQRYGSTASISLDGGGGRRYSELLDYNGLYQEITIATRNVIAGGDVQQVAPGVTVVDNDFREGKSSNFLHILFLSLNLF